MVSCPTELPHVAGSSAKPAKSLKIRVRRNGVTVVEMTQPRSTVERLDSFLDDGMKRRIAEQGVDLDAVVESSRQSGFAPAPLFSYTDGPKEVAVWLE
jgi:hypothetical protein